MSSEKNGWLNQKKFREILSFTIHKSIFFFVVKLLLKSSKAKIFIRCTKPEYSSRVLEGAGHDIPSRFGGLVSLED